MNSLKTVLFPATVIHSIRQYPLFLLFPQLHILSPTESQDSGEAQESPDSFIKSGLCQVDTPCPLGEDLDRFLMLVKDIESRKDDYAAQLSSLTLAGMSGTPGSSDDSERSIISELLTPTDVSAEEAQQDAEAKLWQARLVLSIGEILDREEEEIAKNLSVLDDDTSGLFNALKGEMDEDDEDNPFAELNQLKSNFNAVHSGNIANKLKAWATLFEKSKLQDADLFVTTSPDVIDILSESYDALVEKSPTQYTGLEIPGLIGWSEEEALEEVKEFTRTSTSLLNQLASQVKGIMQGEADSEQFQELTSDWSKKLEEQFPEDTQGRSNVTLYLYEGCDVLTLLNKPGKDKQKKNTVVVHVGY